MNSMPSEVREYPPHCQMMRNALRAKDWQQDIIAVIIGQSRSTVNAILTGRQKLTARLAVDYGHLCNLSPEDLLREQDAWLVEMLRPRVGTKLAAIRLRVAETEARIAGDIQAEIDSLLQQRDVISARIAHLTALSSGNAKLDTKAKNDRFP